MKIIDTFLFSEPMEKDLLWVKFNLESNLVSKWLVLESPYTFQGEYKGLHAATVLSDPKFKPFYDRIEIIHPNRDFQPLHGSENNESKNFDRENHQRSFALQYIQTLNDNDWVMISDADESADFSDQQREEDIINVLDVMTQSSQHIVKLQRQRYWFDFDNKCFLPNIHIPFVKAGLIKGNQQYINARHFDHIHKISFAQPRLFEYSYCFRSLAEVWRKKCTYSHTGFTEESVQTALDCNHWPRSDKRGEKVGQEPYDFFEKVELTEDNSPKFVRDNLEYLRTNIVNPNYKANRMAKYGI